MMLKQILIAIGILVLFLCILGFLLKGERFTMYQEATGKTVNVKRGFSFTYLFFGPFVPLFRGHITGFFLTLFVECFSCGIARLILLFCYNGMYINWLVKNGFCRQKIDEQDGEIVSENLEQAKQNFIVAQDVSLEQEDKDLEEKTTGKYQRAESVIQPVHGSLYANGCEDDTVAVGSGALIGVSGMYQGAELPINSQESIVIGRDAENSNLVITDKAVSRRHCSVSYDAFCQYYIVIDHSTNGVYLKDGSQITPGQPVVIYPGDTIRLGNTEHVFRLK